MKKLLAVTFIFALVAALLLPATTQAQTELSQNYKGEYVANTIYFGVNEDTSDESNSWIIPPDVASGTFYVDADTISTGDSLVNIRMLGSPDNVTWYNADTLATAITAAGQTRVNIDMKDRYIKIHYDVAGASVKNDFSIKMVPKKEEY